MLKKVITLFSLGVISLNIAFASSGNTQEGGKLAARCAACHGPNGNSTVPIYPKLAGQNEKYFIEQMHEFQKGPKGSRNNPIMQNFAINLTDQQIKDLAAYFASQKVTIGKTKPKELALGQRIYQAGIRDEKIPACSACHSPTGAGNAEAGFPALSGQHADYVVAQLKAYKNGVRKSGKNKIMDVIAKQMNEKQMLAVASYIAGLHARDIAQFAMTN